MSSREEHGNGIERGAAECHRIPNEVVDDKDEAAPRRERAHSYLADLQDAPSGLIG